MDGEDGREHPPLLRIEPLEDDLLDDVIDADEIIDADEVLDAGDAANGRHAAVAALDVVVDDRHDAQNTQSADQDQVAADDTTYALIDDEVVDEPDSDEVELLTGDAGTDVHDDVQNDVQNDVRDFEPQVRPVADDAARPLNGSHQLQPQMGAELNELRRRLDNLQRFDSATSEIPAFREVETDLTERPQSRLRKIDETERTRLWETFTPTRPKTGADSFVGRRQILKRIVRAIEEERSHIVLFGGRGIGKTSLSNIISESAREAGFHVLRYPCGSDTTFEELFRAFLSNLPVDLMDRSARGNGPHVRKFEELVPAGAFSPTDLTRALDHLVEHVIFVVDEFDRVLDEDLKRKLAETIKNVSDSFGRVTFVILGIGQSLEDLLGKHPSVQRHILGVRLPLMAPDELEALIRHGEDEAGIEFNDVARDLTVTLSKGLPYYAQLIGLYAGRSALERGSRTVEVDDLRQALDNILNEMDPIMVALYDRATRGERNRFMTDIMFAAAFSKFDAYGSFTAAEAAAALKATAGTILRELNVHSGLTQIASNRFGPILTKFELPSGDINYAFVNPAMRQYILLRQARRRGIL